MLTKRPLPRTPLLKALSVIAAFSAIAVIAVWLSLYLHAEWLVAVLFVAAVPVGNYFFAVSRCPDCGQRLTTQRKMSDYSTAYRVLSRCDQCQIDWDTGLLGDTRYDD